MDTSREGGGDCFGVRSGVGLAGRPAGSLGSGSCVSRGLLSRHQVWVAFQLWQEEADLAVPCGMWVSRGVCGQFWTVPGSLCRCL